MIRSEALLVRVPAPVRPPPALTRLLLSPEGVALDAPGGGPRGSRVSAPVARVASGRRRVALILQASDTYARNLMQGVFAYAREHAPWTFSLGKEGHSELARKWLASWEGDGIITRITSPRMAEMISASGLPTVDLGLGRHLPAMPSVGPDNQVIARLAADHFTRRGFRNFAYCSSDRCLWSAPQGDFFLRAVADFGFPCHLFKLQHAVRPSGLDDWLRALPKPVAVLACNDACGQVVLEACRHAGIMVPDQVAVLGVDNDELVCETATPPMSSIIPNAPRAGYEAARLLDRMMRGDKLSSLEARIEPLGVSLRRSTDIIGVDDPQVAAALQFIRQHACEPITPADVARATTLSRRSLERRFQRFLSRTLREEVLAARLNHVKQLLTGTRLSLEQIAETVGYEHSEYLSVVFKREVGLSPRQYRDRNLQGHGDRA